MLQVHSKSDEANRYFVVLDAAAHAASHVLDLALVKPDFVTLSFYKVWTLHPLRAARLAQIAGIQHLRLALLHTTRPIMNPLDMQCLLNEVCATQASCHFRLKWWGS